MWRFLKGIKYIWLGIRVSSLLDWLSKKTRCPFFRVKGRCLGITIKEEKGKIFLAEKPENDLELAIIEASFTR